GLAVHTDDHDVFVLQSFGLKHWEIWPPGSGRRPPGPPMITRTLEPGDCLYMPRGTPHAARAQEGASGHLTVGILSMTWRDVPGHVAQRALENEPFAEPLPAGSHRARHGSAALGA